MLPRSYSEDLSTIELNTLASKTYKLDIDHNRLIGFTDELDAIKQAIYLILNIERYEYVIYSWNYGFELDDLYGQDINYVISEVQQRIKEALLQDVRITGVDNFSFKRDKTKLHVTFTAHTMYGDIDEGTEVFINGV